MGRAHAPSPLFFFALPSLPIVRRQNLLVFLQDLPTGKWTEAEVAVVLAEAFRLKYTFQNQQ